MEKTMAEWHDDFLKLLGERGKFVFRQKDENTFIFSGVMDSLSISAFPSFPVQEVEVSINRFSLTIKGRTPKPIIAYLKEVCKKN